MMKVCAICAHENKPSAYSCTACGEASWVSPAPSTDEIPTVRLPSVAPAPPPDDLPAPKPQRRGARGPA